jgi:uncharacterized protein
MTRAARHGDELIAEPFPFAFNDLFTFRNNRIARVDTYVVPLSTI